MGMKLISNQALRDFAVRQPAANQPLQAWLRLIERSEFRDFAQLKATFGSVDKVGDRFIFNIGGNKYRLVASVAFRARIGWVKAVLTHDEYDKEQWK